MPMEIIRKHQRIETISYGLEFDWADMPGAGFLFACDEQGNVLRDQINPLGLENLEKCLNGEHDVIPLGVKRYTSVHNEPAIGRCSCKREIVLEYFTNTCECGLEYNPCGELLGPRCQW